MNKNFIKASIPSSTMAILLSGTYISLPLAIVTAGIVTYASSKLFNFLDFCTEKEKIEYIIKLKKELSTMYK